MIRALEFVVRIKVGIAGKARAGGYYMTLDEGVKQVMGWLKAVLSHAEAAVRSHQLEGASAWKVVKFTKIKQSPSARLNATY